MEMVGKRKSRTGCDADWEGSVAAACRVLLASCRKVLAECESWMQLRDRRRVAILKGGLAVMLNWEGLRLVISDVRRGLGFCCISKALRLLGPIRLTAIGEAEKLVRLWGEEYFMKFKSLK